MPARSPAPISIVTDGDPITPLELVPTPPSRTRSTAAPVSARPAAELEVLIPVLNEEQRIGPTLIALVAYLERQPWSSTIVVVDNGCTDSTLDVVDAISSAEVPITAIGCSTAGKGAAVSRGMLTTGSRWVGFMDADLSTPVATIGAAVDLLAAGEQVVIGSRRCPGANVLTEQSVGRRMGGAAFRAMARTISPDIADTQCGFKFFDAATARALFAQARAEGFAFDVEIVSLAATAGIAVTELPVQWSDAEGSSFKPLTDGTATAWELVAVHDRRATERTRVARLPAVAEPRQREGRRGQLARLITGLPR
jgi:dolichyl-phosphate beta-glucosyltransferase